MVFNSFCICAKSNRLCPQSAAKVTNTSISLSGRKSSRSTEPNNANMQDILKLHVNKQIGCHLFKSAVSVEDTKATCGDCDWYTEKGGYCKHGHHFTKPDKTACIEHYNPKNESTISTCSDCKPFQPAIERCAKRTEQETEFCAKPQNIACTTFFEPKEKPKHICSDCELYKFDKSKPDDPFHKCTLPPGHYCSPTHEACLKFKKKSKNTCDECYFYEKKVDGPVTTQHCNKQNSFAFATSDGKACKEFKPKVKKISPKRTCKQCHWMRSENGNHHTCVSHEDIEHVIHPDADATKCPSFAPIVKAKDGSVCYSCQWVLSSKEHCTYRTEPGADFPKGDKCAFHALQLMGFKDTKKGKPEWAVSENLVPVDLAVQIGCDSCKYWENGYCKSTVQHKIKSKGTPFVVCEEYTKKEPNTQQIPKTLKPEFANMLKNFQKMEDKKKASEEPLKQLVEPVCKKCEHFGVLTNGKSICGTEDTPQLYTEADQTACKEHFKPKPLKTCKTAKPGQRKVKWQEK